ncbi:MAG: YicC family protein [Eubacterium sp.]|nr:YicC family protein [Eubacterium sp.]
MIKSMTGFGRGEYVSDEYKVTVEVKAVNHRYCDLSIKLPRKLNSLERKLRSYIKKAVSRGKLDVYVSFEELSERTVVVSLSEAVSRQYYDACMRLSDMLDIPDDLTAMRLARMPEVLTLTEEDRDLIELEPHLMAALKQALGQFADSRISEGRHLEEDIAGKLSEMEANILTIEKRYPLMLADYRKKLLDKVTELLGESSIDENRIATEVVIYADKICVDEETVRLRSHIKHMKDELEAGGTIGRKLDFIAQEMNREANTILSKANDMEISNCAIDLKTEIEKIREQVQNIE